MDHREDHTADFSRRHRRVAASVRAMIRGEWRASITHPGWPASTLVGWAGNRLHSGTLRERHVRAVEIIGFNRTVFAASVSSAAQRAAASLNPP